METTIEGLGLVEYPGQLWRSLGVSSHAEGFWGSCES